VASSFQNTPIKLNVNLFHSIQLKSDRCKQEQNQEPQFITVRLTVQNRCNCCIIKETSLCQILEVLAERRGQLELADFIFFKSPFFLFFCGRKREILNKENGD